MAKLSQKDRQLAEGLILETGFMTLFIILKLYKSNLTKNEEIKNDLLKISRLVSEHGTAVPIANERGPPRIRAASASGRGTDGEAKAARVVVTLPSQRWTLRYNGY